MEEQSPSAPPPFQAEGKGRQWRIGKGCQGPLPAEATGEPRQGSECQAEALAKAFAQGQTHRPQREALCRVRLKSALYQGLLPGDLNLLAPSVGIEPHSPYFFKALLGCFGVTVSGFLGSSPSDTQVGHRRFREQHRGFPCQVEASSVSTPQEAPPWSLAQKASQS